MPARNMIALLVVSSFVLVTGTLGCISGDTSQSGGPNLKGEARYAVGDCVYAVTESGFGDGLFELSLERRSPGGDITQEDADAIAEVVGIVLTGEEGERVPPSRTRLRPDAGGRGRGYVVLAFVVDDETFFAQTWTLEWPGHDPLVVSSP